jgi:2-C-methyl-D-erythritol 4-phosphate cytidylyltransferase
MNALVLTAAGSSTRMGGQVKKEYLTISTGPEGRVSVLSQSLCAFLSTKLFSIIVITVPEGGEETARAVLAEDSRVSSLLGKTGARLFFTEGGATRQASVFAGLETAREAAHEDALAKKNTITSTDCANSDDLVLIHDAARPFVKAETIEAIIERARDKGAAVPAIPSVDTEKEIDSSGKITRHLDRSSIVAVQTPQGFALDALVRAHRAAADDGKTYTDDAEIWGRYAGDVWTCPGDRANRKITYAGDL